jgi:glycosyltransferase involved in cell wall biosynthesis
VTAHERARVVILHNVVAPYRLPLFTALGRSYDVHVLFCSGRAGPRKWDTAVRGAGFDSTVLAAVHLGPFVLNVGLLRVLFRRPADVYIAADNDENVLSIVVLALFAALKRAPLIVWNEHVIDGRERRTGLLARCLVAIKRVYRRWLYARAAAFLSMSGSYTDAFLAANDVDPALVFTGTQVMPQELLPHAPRPPAPAKPYLLFLGYLRPEKGVNLLIEAFRGLDGVDLELVIAGTGPQESRLLAQAEGEERVHLLGYVDGIGKAELIVGASALVVPSLYEPWGMVVNEALAYGTPVLCSAAVAASVLLRGGGGATFAPGRVDALADAIKVNVLDPTRLATLRAQAGAHQRDGAVSDPELGIQHFTSALRRVTRH